MIYLDNAATSFPKPAIVYATMDDFMRHRAGNPGRAGHRLALAAQAALDEARRQLAALFNAPDPKRLIFALNTTDALNIALKGLLRPGDHVVATSMEHNAVVRPLTKLGHEGVSTTYVQADEQGLITPADVEAAITPDTKLVVINHASNVTGTVQPLAEIATVARQHGLLCVVDAAQSAGCLPLDVQVLLVDVIAFPGHKSLLGPPGTGGLWVGERAQIRSFREGGTGLASESPEQPDEYPEHLEAGTANSVGIAGLAAGVQFVRQTGIDTIRAHEAHLSQVLWEGLRPISRLTLYGPGEPHLRTGVVSFTLEGYEPTDVAAILDSSFEIAVRPGLHCAPLAHRTLGTFSQGTVRMSCGFFNTEEEIATTIDAVRQIAGA